MRLFLALAAAALLDAPLAPAQSPAAPAASQPAKFWLTRPADYEEFIRTAPVGRVEEIPVGVTKPRRAFFKPVGLVASVIVKNLKPGRTLGYWESYQSEIAAYELDKLLDLGMVPVTVEKRVEGQLMSAQLWVENCVWLKTLKGQQSPDIDGWNRQVHRQRLFDNLIANIDRNEGNLLVLRSPEWNLVLVDHSRAFTSTLRMPFQMTRIDRPLFERLKALDEATLNARVWPLLLDGVRSLLKRRDQIVAHFEKLAAAKGEAAVFIP